MYFIDLLFRVLYIFGMVIFEIWSIPFGVSINFIPNVYMTLGDLIILILTITILVSFILSFFVKD